MKRDGKPSAGGGGNRRRSVSHRDRAKASSQKTTNAAYGTFTSARAAWVLGIFLLIVAVFAIRLFYLQVIVAPEYSSEAAASRTIDIDLTPRRGTIYDRNGIVLATSVDATTVYCNPREVTDASGEAAQIAAALGGDASDYQGILSQGGTSFAYVKRQADVSAASGLAQLGLAGIYFLPDSKRVYPNGQIGAQIVGLVGTDGKGLTGLELYYDDILGGTEGHLTEEIGANGVAVPNGVQEKTPAVDGQDIVISIDVDMQEYLEGRLSQCVSDNGGESGNAILYDGATGEILACASTPYFNPNDTSTITDGSTVLKGICNAFEPGSIFKAITLTSALENGAVTADQAFDCPASLSADGYTVSDAHDRDDETMTVRQIIAQSSNVGASLIAKTEGFAQLASKIDKYNLDTDKTGVDYPGEATGYLLPQSQWSTVQSYNVSFGQGITVTPLAMTRFYGALTDNGIECTPHFLVSKPQSGETETYATEQVIDNTSVIPTVTDVLKGVVQNGTAKAAAIDGYQVAGKTGTAQYADGNGGYTSNSYNISFVGYLPGSSSDLVCFVGVDKVPLDSGTTSAFKDIMSFAIDRYRIMPQ